MKSLDREIIRAAAYVECALMLDKRAQHYMDRGQLHRRAVSGRAIEAEADHLRDLAVKIRSDARAAWKDIADEID